MSNHEIAGLEGRRRIVLLGAGASVEAGIPASFEMTRRMIKHVQGMPQLEDRASLLNYVCGRIIAYDTARGADPFAGIDVERLLAALRLLARRADLEISPFVSTWDPGVDALARLTEWSHGSGRDLVKAIRSDSPFVEREVDQIVRRIIRSEVGEGDPHAFTTLFDVLVGTLREMLRFEDTSTDYLRPLVQMSRHQGRMTIVTLNYDLTVETVARRENVICDTGFDVWTKTGDIICTGDLHLLKLHGSIDWREAKEARRQTSRAEGFSRVTYEVTTHPYQDRGLPVVVFGAGEKLRSDGPFLDLFMEAKRALSDADEFVVVGYSFRDDHVNDLIGEWLALDSTRTMVVITPSLFGSSKGWAYYNQHPFVRLLSGSLFDRQAKRDGREPNHRLTVIRNNAGAGLAELLAGPPYPSALVLN